jgi:hypothetical protein
VRALVLNISSPDSLLPPQVEAAERLIGDFAPVFALARFVVDFFAAGIAYLPPGFGADVFLSAGFAPVCPRKSRVGANSPSLCPTMFSVTYTGMNLFPLCTAKVCPTKSGSTVLARDHVLITFFEPAEFCDSTFFTRAS